MVTYLAAVAPGFDGSSEAGKRFQIESRGYFGIARMYRMTDDEYSNARQSDSWARYPAVQNVDSAYKIIAMYNFTKPVTVSVSVPQSSFGTLLKLHSKEYVNLRLVLSKAADGKYF